MIRRPAISRLKSAAPRHVWSWRLAIGACAALGLSACTDLEQTPAQTAPVPNIGAAPASLTAAAGLFNDICLDHFPGFAGSAKAVPASVFRQNPKTGTYYHQNLDLSVKITPASAPGPARCSMVFSSKDAPSQLAIAFGAMAIGASTSSQQPELGIDPATNASRVQMSRSGVFKFSPGGKSNGKRYYVARVDVGG